MATAPDDVIRYLRTSGGSEGVKASYADQTFIGFAIGSDVSDREAAFAKFAFLAWAELMTSL